MQALLLLSLLKKLDKLSDRIGPHRRFTIAKRIYYINVTKRLHGNFLRKIVSLESIDNQCNAVDKYFLNIFLTLG